MKKIKLVSTSLALVVLFCGCSVFGSSTTEEASYSVDSRDGKFEIRKYPKLVLVETVYKGSREKAQNVTFSKLFDYILGENQSQQEVAMTAPVLIEGGDSENIRMTAPVFQSDTEEGYKMSFILPEFYTLASAPQPTNKEVSLSELPARKCLVYSFSGFLNAHNVKVAEKALLDYASEKGIKLKEGSLISAGYNPPWTIPFLRRNEIIAEIVG
jgi:effector-binding domain-containing protein